MSIVVDCTSTPSVASLKAAGVSGVCRYLSWLHLWGGKTHAGINPKIIQRAELERLIAGGFSVALNWEYDDHDWMGGASAGAAHAAEAVAQARALGYPPGCVIIGSADFDMTSPQWTSAGRAYAVAFAKGITAGRYVPGVYGPWDVLGWCKSLAVFSVYWQAGMSKGWSGGRNANRWPGAHLRQLRKEDIGGVSCDVNEILQSNYRQYSGGNDMLSDEQATALLAQVADIHHTVTECVDPATGPTGPRMPLHSWTQAADALLVKAAAPAAAAPVVLTQADRDAIVAALAAKVPALDVDALAAKVADLLSARLQS
jgi:hypothetical protein